jgi:hypothetical protein
VPGAIFGTVFHLEKSTLHGHVRINRTFFALFGYNVHTSHPLERPMYTETMVRRVSFAWQQWATLAVVLIAVARAATTSNEATYRDHVPVRPQSFSSQEQALFGNCNADDCVLGVSMGYSYYQQTPPPPSGSDDTVLIVRRTVPDKPTQELVGEEMVGTGFGKPPTFARRSRL